MNATLITYVLLATISPIFAGIIPILLQRKEGNFQGMTMLLLGISAGMLFAVSTLDLIPEAIQFAASSVPEHVDNDGEHLDHLDHEREESIRVACMGIFVGFITLFIIQQVITMTGGGHSHSHSPSHSHSADHHHGGDLDHHLANNNGGSSSSNDVTPFLYSQNFAALVGLALHAFVDGVMISGAFSASEAVGGKVGIAIVLHKFPDGFVLSSLLQQNPKFKSHRKHKTSKITWFLGICSMTIVGAVLSSLLLNEMPKRMLGFTLGLGAGSFLFITCVVILPELLEAKNKLISVVSFIIGYLSFLSTELFFHAH